VILECLRSSYIFTPLSYASFKDKCEDTFKEDSLYAYLLSGGSPVGANALAETGRLPEYIISMMSDWIYGEFAASGRSRAHLLAVLHSLYRMGGNPIGQAKLSRESGLANNTVAQNYIELLSDLMTVIPAYPLDLSREVTLFRKPCKFHFINLLMAICWHPKKPRTIDELKNLGPDLGMIIEWAVAQEIWRKLCIESTEALPDYLCFWQSKEHEIDFILPEKNLFLEVKAGKCSPLEFVWFLKIFKKQKLTVVNKNTFEADRIIGMSLESFLLSDSF
jgi:predicted AAA+ superfamily ATPase